MIEQVWQWLRRVPDPEIPVVSVVDLGIIRDVSIVEGSVEVAVAPTYSGCPATEVIEQQIIAELEKHGLEGVSVIRVLSPPWTTDWISESGREKLRKYGITPPAGSSGRGLLKGEMPIACPRCSSTNTSRISEFGSTACKASYRCDDCLEPFEYFKCI